MTIEKGFPRQFHVFRAFVLLVGLLLSTACQTTLGTVLRDSRFSELRPATTLVPPGTVVQLINRDPVSVSIICSQEEALGHPRVMESTSQNSQLVSKIQTEFTFGAEYLDQLGLDSRVSAIKNLILTITNVKVLEITDGTVFTSVRNATEGCRQAVKFRLEQDQPIALVKSVVQADVRYGVNFTSTSTLDAMDQRKLNRDLAIKLEADLATVTEHGFDGSALFWGLRYDGRLAQLITPEIASLDPSAVQSIAQKIRRVLFPVDAAVTTVQRSN